MNHTVEEYKPRLHNDGGPAESKKEYLNRIHPLLPNFPDEVLLQWFYDHHHAVGQYEGLDYPTLEFEKVTWQTEDVPSSAFGPDRKIKTIEQRRHDYFEENDGGPRMSELGDYFKCHGTWPVPPIFLQNLEGNFKDSTGYRYDGAPYHLIEGHRRLALFLGFKDSGKLTESHQVFVMKAKVAEKDKQDIEG